MSRDEEKGVPAILPTSESDAAQMQSNTGFFEKAGQSLKQFERTMAYYNVEARGIHRVEPSERHSIKKLGYLQIVLFWTSINLAANNITLGMLGPVTYALSFTDCEFHDLTWVKQWPVSCLFGLSKKSKSST